MSGVSPNDSVAFWLDDLLDLVADFAVWHTGFTNLDGFFDGFAGGLDEV